MLKDFEGLCRSVTGYSKTPELDGADVKVDYDLKPLDINWLRKLFNVDPNHSDIGVRYMDRQPDPKNGFQGFKLNKEQYEALKPYMIGEQVDFNEYNFFLESAAKSEWDWRSGFPIQIKKAINLVEELIKTLEELRLYYQRNPSIPVPPKELIPSLKLLDKKCWEEFYAFKENNYPFNELSLYRIDWSKVANYKRLTWGRAIVSPKHVKEFLQSTCLNKFKEVAIAYGPREPIMLITLEYIYSKFIHTFFKDEWGACFIIGVKRNKYGIVELINECFVEVTCGDYLTAPF